MPGIAGVHHPLREVDSSANDVHLVIDGRHAGNRPHMNSDAQLERGQLFQGLRNIGGALTAVSGDSKNTKAIPSPVGKANRLPRCLAAM